MTPPLPRTAPNWRLLGPLLAVGFLTHAILPLARLGLVYLGINEGYGATAIAIVSAFYALVPIFLTVTIGVLNDRGAYRTSVVAGAVFLAASVLVALLLPPTIAVLLASNAIMGIGQALLINSVQTMLKQAGNRDDPDGAIGHYMVVVSAAQVVGPLMIAALASSPTYSPLQLLQVGLESCVALIAAALVVAINVPRAARVASDTRTSAMGLLRSAPLRWVIISSAVSMGAGDLILIFLPLLGTERMVDPSVIGTLLALRAAVGIPTRLFYGGLVRRLGRRGMMLMASIASAAGFIALAVPLSVWGLAGCVVLTGIGAGLVMPATLALTFAIAPEGAVGMATSLRTTLARITQFGGPFAAGVVASATGTGGVFVVTGALVAISAAGTYRALKAPGAVP